MSLLDAIGRLETIEDHFYGVVANRPLREGDEIKLLQLVLSNQAEIAGALIALIKDLNGKNGNSRDREQTG